MRFYSCIASQYSVNASAAPSLQHEATPPRADEPARAATVSLAR